MKKYGNYISGVAFEIEKIDSLYQELHNANIPLGSFDSLQIEKIDDSKYLSKMFALDSCGPVDVVFYGKATSSYLHSSEIDSLLDHPNHVFRFDWVLLSASPTLELRLRRLFDIVHARKLHEGCCDYWRLGPSDDFCFFRFDPLPKKAKGNTNWLSVEPDGIYFAY